MTRSAPLTFTKGSFEVEALPGFAPVGEKQEPPAGCYADRGFFDSDKSYPLRRVGYDYQYDYDTKGTQGIHVPNHYIRSVATGNSRSRGPALGCPTPGRPGAARVIHFARTPGLPGALLDVPSDQPAQDLGGRRIFLGAQALEDSLLARVDENRQAGGTVFEGHGLPSRHATGSVNVIIIQCESKYHCLRCW